MKIVPYNNGNKDSVLNIETMFEIQLPKDYKDFLLDCNGADIEDAYLYVKDLNEYIPMGYFFGVNINDGYADLNEINSEYIDDIPEKSLLIGNDIGEGFLSLINDGEHDGIWYYDHTYFFDKSSDELNTYFICETFTEFMQMLENTVPPKEE